MSSKEKKNRRKLSREILGLFGITMAISVFFYFFLSMTADSIVQTYVYSNNIVFTEIQEWTIENWTQSLSFAAAVFLFVVLFLFLVGQKLAYLNEIIKGIELLRMHRMDFQMPLEGNNELTELAESINFLASTEKELKEKEKQISDEKEALIRTLSHDIRTPLTSILAYSEYMQSKPELELEEIREYMDLMQQKAVQIKGLTDQLLDGGDRNLEYFEDGRLLFYQLIEEWEAVLEEQFQCKISIENYLEFSGKFDVQELRRIFDNLASNVEKYADVECAVELELRKEGEFLVIKQCNKRNVGTSNVESYRIGLESIKGIARQYNGRVEIDDSEELYTIKIYLKYEM